MAWSARARSGTVTYIAVESAVLSLYIPPLGQVIKLLNDHEGKISFITLLKLILLMVDDLKITRVKSFTLFNY